MDYLHLMKIIRGLKLPRNKGANLLYEQLNGLKPDGGAS